MLTATYLGLGAMNLDTDAAGDTGKGGGDTVAAQIRRLVMPKGTTAAPPKSSFFDTVKQALTPKPPSTIVPVYRGGNTVVPVHRGGNEVVPVIRAGDTPVTPYTPPKPVTITVKPPPRPPAPTTGIKTAPPAPGPIPTQGVVCIAPIVNVRAGGPSWAIVPCSTKGSRQVSLAEALKLTGGSTAPPPQNYDPTAGRPPPIVLPPTTNMQPPPPPVPAPPASVPDATPAETAATAITASSQTAQTVANLPPVQTDIPTTSVIPTMPTAQPRKSKKGWLIAGGVVAVGAAIAAAVYGQHH